MIKMAAAGVLMLACFSACADQALCDQLMKSIVAGEKTVAMEVNGGLGDDSAPRETSRQLRAANAWSAITTSLRLMELNRCPAPARVIGPDAYTFQAAKCALDSRMRPSPESCKTSLWEPNK